VLSATSEAAASMSFQTAPPRSARPDPLQASDSFQTLVDGSAPSDSANDRANATAQQQPAAQRSAGDATSTAENNRSREAASADPAARDNSDDRDGTAKQRSAAEADGNANAVQQSKAKPGALKAGTAKSTEKKSTDLALASETASASDCSSAPDFSTVAASLAPQGAASVTMPNAVAVAIPVIVASTDIPPPTPAPGNTTAPLAIAAAAIAASSSGAAAPATSVQIASDSEAAAAVAASAATASVVATATAPDAKSSPKVTVQAPASEAVAAPVQQQATQTVAPAIADPTLTAAAAVAAAAPVAAKTASLEAPVVVPAKPAASTASETTSAAPDAATPADTAAKNVPQLPPTAARQESGNNAADGAKADASAASSPTTAAAVAAHQHSPVDPAAHGSTDAPDKGVQMTGTIQPQLTSTATSAAPVGPLSVTAATNAAVPLSGLALEIAAWARSGKTRFEIRLDPADLGRIDVRIDVDRNGQVTSHLRVEKPDTLFMLRQDAPQLQRALDDAGLKTGNGGLQFSLRDQSPSRQDNGSETGRNAQRLVISDEDTIPAAVAGRTYGRVLGSSSGVDIRV
jgi:flagellar hook-length control protein FliK